MDEWLNKLNKEQISAFSSFLCKLSPSELITLGCVSAIILNEFLTPNEQNVLGNFLEMIGQILLTSYAQATTVNPRYINATLSDFQNLKQEILSIVNLKIK